MSATPVRTIRLRRAFALGLGAILVIACGDSTTVDPDIDGDDDTTSSSSGRASSGGSSGRASSSGGSSGRTGSSSSGSSGGGSSGESSSGSSSGETSSSSGSSSGDPIVYRLGGTVAGYAGSGLVLASGGQTLSIAAGATTFQFAQALPTGAGYEVEISAQPTQPAQVCTVANAEGIIEDADVTNVAITCTTTEAHLVRVVTQGLVGSVTLQNNGGDALVVNGASGAFVTPVATGSTYAVTVSVQPPGQVCTVSNGSGTIAAADVTVNLTCVTQDVEPLGGIVTGLTAPGLVLANGADRLAVDEDDFFEMPTGVAVGAAYNLTVFTQPPGQICTVTNGQGVMIDGGYNNVEVECAVAGNGPFPVTVTVSGLEADSVVINAVSDRTIAANGSFSYDVAKGANYAVTVKRNPRSPQQTCTVVNGSGVVNAPVAVQVVCVTNCAQLIVNEVQVADAEFVELFNKGTCATTANEYTLQYRSASNGIGFFTVVAPVIQPGAYLVYGTAAFPTKDVQIGGGFGNNGGQIGLFRTNQNTVAVDGVAWGNATTGLFREGAPALVPAAGKSIARVPNGKDTHDNSADFKVQNTPTPKAANPAN